MNEALAQTIDDAARKLRRTRPAVEHEIATEAAARIQSGETPTEVGNWHLLQLVAELLANDGRAFGPVTDDEAEAPALPHAGGRPRLLGEDERRRFLTFMAKADGGTKARVQAFKVHAPWCRLTEAQLEAQWRNRRV